MNKKAERLFELTDIGYFPPSRPNAPAKMQEIRETLRNGYRDIRIKLFAEHYSEDQLDALLNFYESELGRSILKARVDIENSFKIEMSKFMQRLDPDDDGGIGVIVERKK